MSKSDAQCQDMGHISTKYPLLALYTEVEDMNELEVINLQFVIDPRILRYATQDSCFWLLAEPK